MMRSTAATALLLGFLFVTPRLALAAPARVFDAPRSTKVVKLPEADGVKATVTCRYYSRFLVKQVDEGEVGAGELAIVPVAAAAPPPACGRSDPSGTSVVDPKDWSGYLKGVKGDYVFFDAADGTNGALGFAVFDLGAKKLFEDLLVGDFHELVSDGRAITLRYRRSFAGDCSVVKDGADCWSKIAAAAGLAAAAGPDCAGGYRKAKQQMAKARCDANKKGAGNCLASALAELDAQRFDESPSVVSYEARTELAAGRVTTAAVGPALDCHPAD